VIDEQLEVLNDGAEEARVRSLVSETPLAQRDYVEAQRHAAAMAGGREMVLRSIAEMISTQDQLLDRLVVDESAAP